MNNPCAVSLYHRPPPPVSQYHANPPITRVTEVMYPTNLIHILHVFLRDKHSERFALQYKLPVSDAERDASANSNVFPLMLLACSVDTPIHINRSHLLASHCALRPASCVDWALGFNSMICELFARPREETKVLCSAFLSRLIHGGFLLRLWVQGYPHRRRIGIRIRPELSN